MSSLEKQFDSCGVEEEIESSRKMYLLEIESLLGNSLDCSGSPSYSKTFSKSFPLSFEPLLTVELEVEVTDESFDPSTD